MEVTNYDSVRDRRYRLNSAEFLLAESNRRVFLENERRSHSARINFFLFRRVLVSASTFVIYTPTQERVLSDFWIIPADSNRRAFT